MNILIDTNVILDVLLKRKPFYQDSINILKLAKWENYNLYVSASAFTDIYYIANKSLKNKTETKALIKNLTKIVSVASVTEAEIKNALALSWKDFEDSVQYSVALLQEMDGIVTRNPDDYEEAIIKIWLPEELLSDLGFSENS